MSYYMSQSTYQHDFVPGNAISPRNRQTDYPYGADAPKADVPGPMNNFRPRFGDPLPQHIRDLDGQRFDEAPLTDRQRVKRGEEWIGGRRYEEPRTDRGVYIPPRRRYYETDGQRNISPNRRYDRLYRDLDDGRHTSLDRPINKERVWETELERQNLRLGRHTSLDRYETMDKRKENLKQYMRNRRQNPFEGGYPERGRNGSPDRHLDRGREYDRPRNESPSRWDRDRNSYNPVDDRRYDPSRDKYKYPDWYEKPLQPMIESYANHHKLADRTTYRDYGEFLQDKIKREELRKQPLEYPAANLGPNFLHDRYLRPEERQLRRELDHDNDNSSVHDKTTQPQNTRPHTEPAVQTWSDNLEPKSTNSGVYLFMRTHMDGKSDVVKALKEGRSVLANSYGQLKGIANNTEIHFLEGRPDGWTHVPSSKSERTWDVGDTVIIFWFPTRKEAEMWLYHEKKFQRASFPEYHGSDMACLPINWNPENDRHYPTFLVTEYEGIVDPDQFREKFVANMYDVLQRHKAERFVIQTVGIKMFRGNWFKQRSVVTCNRFPSSQAALEFYNDPDYERLRRSVRDISKSRTTFMFTLTERPIHLLEGLEGWNIRFNMTRTGDYWSERSQRTSGLDFIIIVFWFPSLNDAEKWVITERKFKNPHFPDPDGSDVVVLPLNDSPPQERLAHTYVMTEYPRSFDPVLFRDKFAPRIKDLLWRKFGIDGFFIQCIRSRYIWGSWIKPSSLVTTIRFNSKTEATTFFSDPEYRQIRQDISRCIEELPLHLNWFRPTTSMFTINEYV